MKIFVDCEELIHDYIEKIDNISFENTAVRIKLFFQLDNMMKQKKLLL